MTPEEIKAKQAELRKWKDEMTVKHNEEVNEIAKIKAEHGDYKAMIKKAKDRVKSDTQKVNKK